MMHWIIKKPQPRKAAAQRLAACASSLDLAGTFKRAFLIALSRDIFDIF
jgi:hypothetical protein